MLSPKQKFGRDIEEMVQKYLTSAGLKVIAANYTCQGGEIDLIMDDDDTLVFVEVRYRQDDDYGGALASVTKSKQSKVIRAAKVYLQDHDLWDKTICRFDVVVVQDINGAKQIHWLKDAFWVSWR